MPETEIIPLTKSGRPDKRYTKPQPRNRKTTYRKIDPDKTTKLIKQGVPLSDIAKMQNVNKSTITRFKDKHSEEFEELEVFKNHKADILADTQLQTVKIRRGLLKSMAEDIEDPKGGALKATSFSQKGKTFKDLTIAEATDHDKEQLERGLPTSNVAMLHANVAQIKNMNP